MGFSVVVLESDPGVARSLAAQLSAHFHAIHFTHSGDELRERVAKSRPEVVVLDMEYSRLTDVRRLHHDFPLLPIVCTHRIPDEQLWIEALDAGASDVCRSDDVQNVLTSVLRSVAIAQTAAA
jgi:two-component system, OmpR family, KDP operon response regulator KdpE